MTPRSFSEAERGVIRDRLLNLAAQHFSRFGYRKANIAEIARAAGIGKGTFYLFFASKGELFVGAVLEVERELRSQLLTEMQKPFPSDRERLRRFLRFQHNVLAEQPLLGLMVDPEEASALMRDLPLEAMEELRVSDEHFFAALATEWQRDGAIGKVTPEVLAALPRALFALTLQRGLIGEAVFPEVMDLVIESVARALTSGNEADD